MTKYLNNFDLNFHLPLGMTVDQVNKIDLTIRDSEKKLLMTYHHGMVTINPANYKRNQQIIYLIEHKTESFNYHGLGWKKHLRQVPQRDKIKAKNHNYIESVLNMSDAELDKAYNAVVEPMIQSLQTQINDLKMD